MIRIAACDGEASFVCELLSILKLWETREGSHIRFQSFAASEDLLAEIELYGPFDLVFMDIRPKYGVDGVEAALKLKKECETSEIVFVSKYLETDHRIFSVRPLQYLLTPLQKEQVAGLLRECMRICRKSKFYFRNRQCTAVLWSSDIRYIVRDKRKLEINCRDGEKYVTYMCMEEAEQRLKTADTGFFKVHYSYLVNLYFVSKMSGTQLVLDDGEIIPVSRSCSRKAAVQFERYLQMRLYG